jgi:hypothetical protein
MQKIYFKKNCSDNYDKLNFENAYKFYRTCKVINIKCGVIIW